MTMTTLRKNIMWSTIATYFLLTAVSFAGTSEHETTMKEVKQEMKEAASAIKNYSAGQRDEATKRIKASLNKLDAQIERLQERLDQKADHMDQAARQQARTTLKALRKQRNEVAEWVGGMQHSSNEAWKDIKAGFLKSYQSMQEAFNKAQDEF